MNDLFGPLSSDDEQDTTDAAQFKLQYEERKVVLSPDYPPVLIRESDFSATNANVAWPSNSVMVQWLMDHRDLLEGRTVLDLGAGTAVLAIFLALQLPGACLATSDYPDDDIRTNISYNWTLNGLPPPAPHVPHKWGDPFPFNTIVGGDAGAGMRDVGEGGEGGQQAGSGPGYEVADNYDVILANDILLYVNSYGALADTLAQLLTRRPGNVCVMSIGRNLGKDNEALFMEHATKAGLTHSLVGKRIYLIKPSDELQPNSQVT